MGSRFGSIVVYGTGRCGRLGRAGNGIAFGCHWPGAGSVQDVSCEAHSPQRPAGPQNRQYWIGAGDGLAVRCIVPSSLVVVGGPQSRQAGVAQTRLIRGRNHKCQGAGRNRLAFALSSSLSWR